VKCSVKDSNLGYFSSNLLDRFNAFQVGRIVSRSQSSQAGDRCFHSGVTSVLDRYPDYHVLLDDRRHQRVVAPAPEFATQSLSICKVKSREPEGARLRVQLLERL